MSEDHEQRNVDYLINITNEVMASHESKAYVFNIINDPSMSAYAFIQSIGHEWRTHFDKEKYYWDCRSSNEMNIKKPNCIFQYTVSGEGVVEINGKAIRQGPGDFFMIERPGPFRYWLPNDSEHWELKFVDISVSALPIWNGIIQSFGRCFSAKEEDELMQLWNKIFKRAQEDNTLSVFDDAQYAYRFILMLHQHLAQIGMRAPEAESIQRCIKFIEENFFEDLSLVDIAEAGGLSPFYVNKAFKSVLGETPMRYLTKARIRYGMRLLYNTDLSVEDIAEQCGFQNANYFAKVFRKYTNTTPTVFRQQGLTPIFL